jgi:ABC-type multidrug transport system fused ATPase/permease subunit
MKHFIANEFWSFIKKHPFMMGINLCMSLLSPIDDICVPLLMGIIVSKIESRGNWLYPLIILVIILVSMQLLYLLINYSDSRVLPTLQNFVKHRMTESLMNQYDGRAIDFNNGEVMSRMVKIPLVLTTFYENLKNYIVPYMISFMITACAIFKYNKTMGFIVFISALLIFYILFTSPNFCSEFSKIQEYTNSNLDEQIDDVINNLQIVYSSNNTEKELKRLKNYENRYAKAYYNTMKCIIAGRGISISILVFMVLSFMYMAKLNDKKKFMTTGAVITILTIIIQWYGTLGWLSGQTRDLVTDWGVISSFKLPPANKITHNSINLDDALIKAQQTPDIIRLVNVSYKDIIKNMTLSIQPGEKIAIVGDIGSGKSTLLKILLGLYEPTNGYIFVNKKPIQIISKKELRKIIGYVPQNPLLFNRSILENIQYGNNDTTLDSIKQLLQMLGLRDTFTNLDMQVDKGGMRLSGGQRQLIAVIRTLLNDPKILVMDEITSSIDKGTKTKLFKVLNYLFTNKTVIMVTHDPDLLSLATRIIKIKDGKIEIN